MGGSNVFHGGSVIKRHSNEAISSKNDELVMDMHLHLQVQGENSLKCEIGTIGALSSLRFTLKGTIGVDMLTNDVINNIRCEECGTLCKTQEKRSTCNMCLSAFSDSAPLTDEKHMRSKDEPKNHCSICRKSFSSTYYFRKHMFRHTGIKSFYCLFCSKAFSSRDDVRQHLHVHTDETFFPCATCGKIFKHKRSLQRHMRKFSECTNKLIVW